MSSQASSTPRSFPFPPADDPLEVEPAYAVLRTEEPVTKVVMPHGGEAWLATRYEDVKTVFTDPRLSRSVAASVKDGPRVSATPTFGGSVNTMDGEDHVRLRSIVAPAFTRSSLKKLRPRIQRIADELIDEIVSEGNEADFCSRFTERLPVASMCEILGVPFKDRHLFRSWSTTVLSNSGVSADQYEEANQYIHDYVARRIDESPTEGILGLLVAAREQHRASNEELMGFAGTLLVGGHSTLVSHMTNAFYLLLSRRALWEQIVSDPAIVETAADELLRYIPLGVGAGNPRAATEDMELSGVSIKAGEFVVVARHSANRDADAFENPDEIDLRRVTNPHLGFGFGHHFCAGAQLARLEMQVALGTVTQRLPQLQLAVSPDAVRWRTNARERRLIALPVSW